MFFFLLIGPLHTHWTAPRQEWKNCDSFVVATVKPETIEIAFAVVVLDDTFEIVIGVAYQDEVDAKKIPWSDVSNLAVNRRHDKFQNSMMLNMQSVRIC